VRSDPVWLWLALAVAWLATVDARPLLEPDEARYAEIPREMQVTGDWVTPHLNGLLYLEKPPLQYWATASLYSLFGLHEWSARLWAVAVSFLALPLCALLARRLYGPGEFGIAAASALAASPVFAIVGQLNLLDGAFTTLLCASLFAFVAAQRAADARATRRWIRVAAVALGLAVLSKGIVALVLPGAALVAYSALTRDLGPWRRLHWPSGLALLLLVTVPWFWAAAVRNPGFLSFFFVHEHFARFLTTVHHRSRPIWYFVPVLAGGLLPFLALLPAAARAPFARPSASGEFRAGVFLAVFVVVAFAFFSSSGSKLAPYILPCLPPAAVLLAPELVARPHARALALAISCGALALAALGLLGLGVRGAGTDAPPPTLVLWSVAALAVAGAAALAGWRLRARDSAAARWAPLALGAVLGWQCVLTGYTALPPLRTARALVEQVRPEVGPDTRLYSVGQYRQSVPPYLQRTLRLAAFRGELSLGRDHAPELVLPTVQAFVEEWNAQTDAVAFMDPEMHEKLLARGLPGRIIAADAESVAIARR
jgi:4-amino-4-deoxy-L-arabinose transferase-like glycosyltransferase